MEPHTKLICGKIVLLKFPFTDAMTFKRRPGLLLKEFDDGDILVCRITGQFYDTAFDLEIADWKAAGLKIPSVIRLHKMATIDKDMVEDVLGEIPENIKKQIRSSFMKIID